MLEHAFKLYQKVLNCTKNKKLFFVFVDLEKAFDQLPREVIHFALRWKGVPEYFVNGVMSLDKGCKTAASVDGELSSS